MACSCQNKTVQKVDIPHIIKPDESCIFCAEKHLSTAMRLVKENGYIKVNRQNIIGELVLFQWHTYENFKSLAEKGRNLRHMIQQRRENEITDQWENLCIEINSLIEKELSEDK